MLLWPEVDARADGFTAQQRFVYERAQRDGDGAWSNPRRPHRVLRFKLKERAVRTRQDPVRESSADWAPEQTLKRLVERVAIIYHDS